MMLEFNQLTCVSYTNWWNFFIFKCEIILSIAFIFIIIFLCVTFSFILQFSLSYLVHNKKQQFFFALYFYLYTHNDYFVYFFFIFHARLFWNCVLMSYTRDASCITCILKCKSFIMQNSIVYNKTHVCVCVLWR